jgi:hypothetical protein
MSSKRFGISLRPAAISNSKSSSQEIPKCLAPGESVRHQMIDFHRDQADIIRKIFARADLLNLVDQLPA